jgi:hypothetical protein
MNAQTAGVEGWNQFIIFDLGFSIWTLNTPLAKPVVLS